jgi:hypothetical protein
MSAPNTVVANSDRVHVSLRYTITLDDLDGKEPVDGQQREGDEDADAEDDFGDSKVDNRRFFEGIIGPSVVCEHDNSRVTAHNVVRIN